MKQNWFTKKSVYILIIIAVVVIGIFFYTSSQKAPELSAVKVERKTLVQEVTVSGTVKSKEAVELAFEKSGRVRKVNAAVGDSVFQGAVLLALENGVENADLLDAQAKLASKQAHYDDLKAGGRPEEIQVKATELEKAKSDLAIDYTAVQNIVQDAFNKADNAVRRQADILFSNQGSNNPQMSFNSNDQQAVFDAQNARYTVEGVLTNFKKITEGAFSSNEDNEKALIQSKSYLLTISDFLIKVNRALNAAISLSESTLATDKDALNTARTNINTALTSITDQIGTISGQKITVQTAADELALTKIGATTEALAGALADIQSAQATVQNAQALLAKTYIVSPIASIVTRQDAKIGQIAPASNTLIAVASGNFKIEAFIPEVDVAKIATGNTATITLDAYGSDVVFAAHIMKIDPAETVIDGVSTYKTTLEFDKNDERIRSGMTANTTIIAATKEDVLAVPQRAIYDKGGKKYVKVSDGQNKTTTEVEVTVGLKGSDGTSEIVSGLTEGDMVVTSK